MRKQTEINYEMKLLSSLDKVFQDETPVYRPECMKLSALWGETVSYQAAYTGEISLCGSGFRCRWCQRSQTPCGCGLWNRCR